MAKEYALNLKRENHQYENPDLIEGGSHETCNESLPYPEMIADAARRAGEELANRPQVDPDYLAKLEALVELVAPDIEFKEQTMTDRMTKTQAIVAAYREVRPKEATAK